MKKTTKKGGKTPIPKSSGSPARVPAKKRRTKAELDTTGVTLDRIVVVVGLGCGKRHAARIAGIASSTLYEWIRRGEEEDGEPLFVEFVERLRDAEANQYTKSVLLERLFRQGKNDPKPNQWLLSKLFPLEFGDHLRLTGRLKTDQNVRLSLEGLTTEDLRVLRRIQAKVRANLNEGNEDNDEEERNTGTD